MVHFIRDTAHITRAILPERSRFEMAGDSACAIEMLHLLRPCFKEGQVYHVHGIHSYHPHSSQYICSFLHSFHTRLPL